MEALIVIGLAAAIAGIAAVTVFRTQRRSEARQEQRPPAPWSRSEKLSLVSILVGAALGITGFVISGEGGEPPPERNRREANPIALAAPIRQGPFTEQLPSPLNATGLEDVNIARSIGRRPGYARSRSSTAPR